MKSSSPQKLSLFDSPALKLGGLGLAVKLALNQAVKKSNLSRAELAHQAGEMAIAAETNLCPGGRGLGLANLNKWLTPEADGNFPSVLGLAVLLKILGDKGPLVPLLEFLDLEVMTEEDKRFRDVGKAHFEFKRARRDLKRAEEKLC